ncbi:CD48 antigen [Orycteropus afer afer]|uniref:CD48 antigen n=1 Tax=Orycteropus afer afer TaxID=1230840 RepID=A0A8B7AES6_ORYAF|nr:CD48 antigen [Orycteropus afer afer]
MCTRRWEWYLALGLLLVSWPFLVNRIQAHSTREIVVSGSNVSLTVSKLKPDSYKELSWIYAPRQKIVTWTRKRNPEYFKSEFQDKFHLDDNGTLHIYNVRENDSSTYLLQVFTTEGHEHEWQISLEVYDPVSKPGIKIEMTKEVNNSCYAKLLCETLDRHVNYTWYGDSGPFSQDLQNSVLEIIHTPENHSNFYTCQTSNPVSRKNDTVYFTAPCTLAQSSGVVWIAAWLVVMVPVILSLLLT